MNLSVRGEVDADLDCVRPAEETRVGSFCLEGGFGPLRRLGGVSGIVLACPNGIGAGLIVFASLSGLPGALDLADRGAERGYERNGEIGTLNRLASSGSSSSESWYSASISYIVFLLGCHDPLRPGTARDVAGVCANWPRREAEGTLWSAGNSERVLVESMDPEADIRGLEKYLFETGVAADLVPFSTDRRCRFSCVCKVARAGLLVVLTPLLTFSLLLDLAKTCRVLLVW